MIAAVIPIKRLAEAKSRLSPHLSADQRVQLARRLLVRTVAAVRMSGVVDRIALATPEPGLAEELGVALVPDQGSLNASLSAGVRWAIEIGSEALLILPADLAAVTAEDVQAVVREARHGPGIVICRTVDGGTGALLLMPPNAVSPAYGPDSFERHIKQAAEFALDIRTVDRPGLARDVDTIAQLEAVDVLH